MFEQRVCRFFGCERNPDSGAGGTETRADNKAGSPLFIEAKLRATSAIHVLFAEVEKKAAAENKTPVLGLQWKNHAGWLLVCRPQDVHLLSSLAKDYEALPDGKD